MLHYCYNNYLTTDVVSTTGVAAVVTVAVSVVAQAASSAGVELQDDSVSNNAVTANRNNFFISVLFSFIYNKIGDLF